MDSERMAAESGSSTSIRQRGRVKPPLITCPDCRCCRVVELKSKKPWSKGHIFYTCPNHKSDGTGCPFWHWEDSYVQYLKDEEKKNGGGGGGNEVVEAMATGEEKKKGGGDDNVLEAMATVDSFGLRVMDEDSRNVLRALLASCKEIAWLLKCMVVLCMVVLLLVIVMLLK